MRRYSVRYGREAGILNRTSTTCAHWRIRCAWATLIRRKTAPPIPADDRRQRTSTLPLFMGQVLDLWGKRPF
jgi:hypothetical protein